MMKKFKHIIDKIAVDFHTQKEYNEYMDDHPAADRSKHKLLDQRPKETGDKLEKIRKKLLEHDRGGKAPGMGNEILQIRITGPSETVQDILSAMGDTKPNLEPNKDGTYRGYINLNHIDADEFVEIMQENKSRLKEDGSE